jgi:tetratricopeptide (TPR) repeat protein
MPRWIWVVAIALALPRGAIAEPAAKARADALFAEGNAAIARNDAATAAERYRAAWELLPEARFVLNLGIVLAELGRNAAAAEAIAIYLSDPASDPGKRPVLEQRLALWRAALGEIAATPFERLIPGHGEPMTRDAFAQWRAAFDALLDCAASPAEAATCVAGWRTGAAAFIPAGDEARIDEYTTYYLTEILRSPKAHERFCHPLRAE